MDLIEVALVGIVDVCVSIKGVAGINVKDCDVPAAVACLSADSQFREGGGGVHIAILEDDEDQRDFLVSCLVRQAATVSDFGSVADLQRAMQRQRYDVFVVDWRLPEVSGLSFVQQLRRQLGWGVPILMITASRSEQDVIEALASGADDFLAKPLRPDELQARVQALGRRALARSERDAVELPPYRVDITQRDVTLAGQAVALTDREYALASLFIGHAGELFSRHQLLEMIWGIRGDLTTRTVDTHVSRLRRKLEFDGRHGWRLRSVYQHGYRLEPHRRGA
ncbi:response regulator transcription factor [Halomonas sp.]|uniref:response regulator transcription factor n=1 Tax=Halomonas sp. TaxID=1486246 RepID=UPI003457F2AA